MEEVGEQVRGGSGKKHMWSNKIAAGNSHRPFSFVSFKFHRVICSGASHLPVAVAELTSEVIRQRFFRIFSPGF